LAEDIISFVTPIRDKAEAIQHDATYLREVMEKGAAKAGASARATIELVRAAMGLKYY
jgi:tryptophanyl-tRNA synthetase